MKTAEIISSGNELIQGEVVDTNSAYIAEELTRRGLDVLYHTTVGDEAVFLGSALERALERADLIVITGGLGPTRDDVTREAVGLSCKKKLVLDETALSHIKETYHCRHMEMPPSNTRQAMLPEGATLIPNKIGTAPGFLLDYNNRKIICLPGVPHEMKRMFEEEVLPHLEKSLAPGKVKLYRKIHVFGLPEALVGEKIEHLMGADSNPQAGTMVHEGVITVRLVAEADAEAEAERLLDKTESEIRLLLGNAVYGVNKETLEEVVADLLKKQGLTIAVAESCTGGLVTDLLTNVPGMSQHLLEGLVTYTPKSKADLISIPEELLRKTGVVNAETARVMAMAMRDKTGADIALSVTGVAGPTSPHPKEPVGLVYIALATRQGVEHKDFHFAGTRRWIKLLAAKNALDMVRLKLLKMMS